MYQGLLLTMLGRLAVLELGVPLGAALLCLMLLPTLLMALRLTPHVLKNIATANAVYEVHPAYHAYCDYTVTMV